MAELDQPVVGAGQRRGDVEVELGAVGAARAERRGHGRRRVDDEEVARREHVRQVAGAEVAHAAGRPLGHEHPHLVALEPARLGRLVRLEALGKDERRSALTPPPPARPRSPGSARWPGRPRSGR